MTISFKGQRTGLASILASSGSGGAAEYLSADTVFAMYASTREPQQLFDELAAQLSRFSPGFQKGLAEAENTLGLSISNDLARSLGTESAFGVESISASGPVWTMALMANDSATLDSVIQRLVDAANHTLANQGKSDRITISQEVVDSRTWKTVKFPNVPLGVTWTYDRGYMIAGSDRGAAARAIAIRNGGSPLVWSAAFQQQLTPSAGMHPSGFAWMNPKGAFSELAAFVPNPAIQQLISGRDPILVLFSGSLEQIRAVSRTRLSGMLVNLMLLQGLDRARAGSQTSLQSGTR